MTIPGEHFSAFLALSPGAAPAPSSLPSQAAVYLVVDEGQSPVFLATCGDLRRVLPARLAAPLERTRRTHLGEVAHGVFWTPTHSRFEASWRYHDLARVFHPDDYRRRLDFKPAWFVRADLGEPIPRLKAAREPRRDGARYVGPFPTGRDAEAAIALLEDLFDLCRKYDILRQAPRGQPCEYLDMGRCAAPCDGRVSMEWYRNELARAMDFIGRRDTSRLDELRQAMRAAAAATEFEKAGAIKSRVERSEAALRRAEAGHIADLATFRWVMLQRGGPATRARKRLLVRPFVISRARATMLAPVGLADLGARLNEPDVLSDDDGCDAGEGRDVVVEKIWLLCRYLFQGSTAAGLYWRVGDVPIGEALVEQVCDRLLARAPARAAEPPSDSDT